MNSYCLKLERHYSGLMAAHFPDFPDVIVLGRDHAEARELAVEALKSELQSQLRDTGKLPMPKEQGRLYVIVSAAQDGIQID